MIRTRAKQDELTREARIWHEKFRRGLLRRLSETEQHDLARLLDELQHAVAHQIELPASKGGR